MAKEDTRETLKLREAMCFFFFLETVQMKRMAPREVEGDVEKFRFCFN